MLLGVRVLTVDIILELFFDVGIMDVIFFYIHYHFFLITLLLFIFSINSPLMPDISLYSFLYLLLFISTALNFYSLID